MFESVDGRTDGRTDDGVTGILIAHLRAFGSGELKSMKNYPECRVKRFRACNHHIHYVLATATTE